jgi:hypothetical protein
LEGLEVTAVVVFGAFEHHMFKQVSKPGPPHLFVFRTHVIPDIYGDYGDGVVLVEYHVQAVGEGMFFEGDGYHWEKTSGGLGSVIYPILR